MLFRSSVIVNKIEKNNSNDNNGSSSSGSGNNNSDNSRENDKNSNNLIKNENTETETETEILSESGIKGPSSGPIPRVYPPSKPHHGSGRQAEPLTRLRDELRKGVDR